MYLLDTNVVSELRKGLRANDNVISWVKQQNPQNLHLSVITILEAEQGYLKLARYDQQQAQSIRRWIDQKLLESFSGRILPIDIRIARCCAGLHIPNRKPYGDAMIAATAISHDLIIVTRNTADFAQANVRILNPWQ